jgi:fructokinase
LSKIVVIGELLVDMISTEYVDDLASASTFSRYFAGSPGNLALNLADLKFETYLLARVGDDSFGKAHIKYLSDRGVKTDFVQVDPEWCTSFILISRSKGTPLFLPLRQADYRIMLPTNLNELLNNAVFIHLTAWPLSREPSRSTTLRIIEEARKMGISICFDPNYRKKFWESGHDGVYFIKENVLNGVFLSKPSLDDVYNMFGKMEPEQAVTLFHDNGVQNVVLSLGEKGAIVSDGSKMRHIPTLARFVIDTTGAGDGFWSGMYFALSQNLDIFTAASFGSAIAAHRVESSAKNDPLPPIREILHRYGLE